MMAKQLSALADLPKNPGSVPSPHTETHNNVQLQFQGIRHPLLASKANRLQKWYSQRKRHLQRKTREGKKEVGERWEQMKEERKRQREEGKGKEKNSK